MDPPPLRLFKPLYSVLFVAVASPCLHSAPEATAPSETVFIIPNSNGESFRAAWTGVPGRTYFPQVSNDLVNWSYAPELRVGNGILQQGVERGSAGNQFLRLVYIDEPAVDSAKADFDGDGVANIVELQHDGDPFNPASTGGPAESARVILYATELNNQQLQNGQTLSGSPNGSAKVSLSSISSAQISSGTIVWGGGISGSYRGLLSPQSPTIPGRSAISTLRTAMQGDVSSAVGFTTNGSLGGLIGPNGMSMSVQLSADGRWSRLSTSLPSGSTWSEMNHLVSFDTEYRTMIRYENNGFSTWVQGGVFSSMGAAVNAPVWFPVSRWIGVNPVSSSQAGIYNSWVGPTYTRAFSDIVNPTIDATSALLDYERNKNGLHVPSLLTLPDGEILAAWQNATGHESTDCVIKVARRNSRGVWGAATNLLTAGVDGASNNGPTLHRAGSEIWLTYQSVSNGIYTVRKRVLSLVGEQFVLSSPVTLFNQGLVINHSLTLPSGRIIVCWHTMSSYWKNRIHYSDDQGRTWKPAIMPEFPLLGRAGEGFALLEANGTLASYWRTDQLSIHRSVSLDHGLTWSVLAPTAIPSANMPTQGLMGSRASGFKRPSDGKLVIIGNDSTTQREKLTAWLVNNGVVEGKQSLLPWEVPSGNAEGLHYPDVIVHPDDSMTVIFSRWQGGSFGSSELHSAINTFKVPAAFD